VWLAEVHFAPRFFGDAYAADVLAAIAERTTRIRLGMAVNLMPLHHPIRLAEEVARLTCYQAGGSSLARGAVHSR